MASVCRTTAVSTVYATSTMFASSTSMGLTTFVLVNPNSVVTSMRTAGGAVTPVLVTGITLTTTSTITSVSQIGTGSVVSSAISTIFNSCTSTTSSTPTPTPTTSPIVVTPGGTTITSFTTVPAATTSSSSSSSSSSAVITAASRSNASTTPVGAIAGGAVGGVAVLFFVALAIWYFTTRSTRNERDKDFDFAGDDAWDPAAGVTSNSMVTKSHSRRGNGRIGAAGGTGIGMNGMNGGNGGGYADYDHEDDGSYPQRNNSRKKLAPADEQYAYYNSSPPNRDPGMAGVGVLRRGPSGSNVGHGQSNSGHGGNDHQEEYVESDPYGGLENTNGGGMDGGYAVAGRLHHGNNGSNHSGLNMMAQQQQQQQQQYGGNQSPNFQQQQSYNNGRYQQQSPPLGANGRAPSPQIQQGGYFPQQQQQQQSYGQQQAPYHPSNSPPPQLAAPNSQRYDNLSTQALASPTPSHRSIPALGAVWDNNSNPMPVGEEHEGRRGGALRVRNEESEEGHQTGYGGARSNGGEDERFASNSGTYEGLTAGLMGHDHENRQ